MADVQPHYDDEDVPSALDRVTQDGPGFESEDELPPSDFEDGLESEVAADLENDK